MKRVISLLSALFVSLLLTTSVFSAPTAETFTERYVNNTLYAGSGSATGTATAGGNTTISLAADASTNDDDYNNYGIRIISGTGTANECRRITDYDATGGATEKLATVDAAWTINPDATTVYEITVGSDSNNGVSTGLYGGTNGAYATIDACIDGRTTAIRVNILAGREYDLLAGITYAYDADGGVSMMAGYTSAAGDGGIAIIDGQSSVGDIFNPDRPLVLSDVTLKGCTDDAIVASDTNADNLYFYHIYILSAGGNGMQATSTTFPWFIIGCQITGTTAVAYTDNGGTRHFLYNYIHDTTAGGIELSGTAAFNIFDTNGGDAISLEGGSGTFVFHNTIYNTTGDNIEITGGTNNVILNNILHTASGWNLNGLTTKTILVYGYNNYYLGTGGTDDGASEYKYNLGNNQTGNPDFVSVDDFDIDTSTTIDDTGYPPAGGWYGNAATGGHTEMGVVPYEETGGAAAGGGRGARFLIQ